MQASTRNLLEYKNGFSNVILIEINFGIHHISIQLTKICSMLLFMLMNWCKELRQMKTSFGLLQKNFHINIFISLILSKEYLEFYLCVNRFQMFKATHCLFETELFFLCFCTVFPLRLN
jgi:hypothetical protein